MVTSTQLFIDHVARLDKPKVLEIGTMQWVDDVSTHHGGWLPDGSTHVKSDIQEGKDVDVVADVHDLSLFGDDEFDAFIAVSVWEHVRKPWVASAEVARVVKPGGIIYVATHFAFPVHGYPSDYCRWTDEGLKSLFDAPEWHSQQADYAFPCTIEPPQEVEIWNAFAPAFLNVAIFAIRS